MSENYSVIVVGSERIEANGSKDHYTIYAFVLGTTEDDQPFIFEPYQELITITEISVFKFKSVVKVETENANRIEADS
mgnify:CR=1 FL=1